MAAIYFYHHGPLCHRCRYDLGGLPTRGLCPECAEPYRITPNLPERLSLRDRLRELKLSRAYYAERLLPTFRTVAIVLLILGSAAVTITTAILAWQAFLRAIAP